MGLTLVEKMDVHHITPEQAMKEFCDGDIALVHDALLLLPSRFLFSVADADELARIVIQEETPLSPTARF